MSESKLRIAAVADIHCSRNCQGELERLFSEIADQADILLLAGDMTDYGLREEAEVLVRELARASRIPRLAVLGNHDYETGNPDDVVSILRDAGVIVMDGDTFTLDGVGIVGIKGFGGGFGRRMLEPWGEPAIKQFVDEAVNESLKLEKGLARLETPRKVVMMHYAPIVQTIEGEPPETYAFLGSSRLEEPLNLYKAEFVVHGHAHHGQPEGRTREGIPVYNVAAPLLKHHFPDRPAVRIFEVPSIPGYQVPDARRIASDRIEHVTVPHQGDNNQE
jgi:Icc-related predicted phosphoesterase